MTDDGSQWISIEFSCIPMVKSKGYSCMPKLRLVCVGLNNTVFTSYTGKEQPYEEPEEELEEPEVEPEVKPKRKPRKAREPSPESESEPEVAPPKRKPPEAPKPKPRKPREPRAPKAPEPEPASYLEVLKRGLDIARNKHKADKVARYDTFFAY